MKVVVVDDYVSLAQFIGIAVRKQGHQVEMCTDASEALDLIDAETHLLISDVMLEPAGGFDLAQRVADKFGHGTLRTILISGLPHDERLNSTPPSVVMGLIQKPFSCMKMLKVLELVEKTLDKCPGCPEHLPVDGTCNRTDVRQSPAQTCSQCFTADYGLCPHYNDKCGLALRQWIANP